jgi:predicted nucleic acid-binding protein
VVLPRNPGESDAFYYMALLNPADHFHTAAIQATQDLRQPLVTTAWIRMEVADALCAPAIRQRTQRFLQHVLADPNTLLITDHMLWFPRGMQLYGNRRDKSWSLTDCISFSVMTERGITDALTGDHHFVQAGFRALLLSP